MPVGRYGMVAAVIDGLFIVVGPETQIWDPQAGTWRMGAPWPRPRSDTAAAGLNGKLYVTGGSYLDVYDPSTNTWAALPAAPVVVQRHSAVSLDGRLHVIGGTVAGKPSDCHMVFDPDDSTWSMATALPTPRSLASAVVRDGRVHVVGGLPDSSTRLTTHEVYDGRTGTWASLAPLPFGRARAVMIPTAHGLRLMGGLDPLSAPIVGGFSYDSGTDSWHQAGGVRGRAINFAWATDGERLYVAGGYEANTDYRSCRVFEPTRDLGVNVWRQLPDGPTDWGGCHGVAAIGDHVYVLSTTTGAEHPMHRLDVVSGRWTTCASKPGGSSTYVRMTAMDGLIYALGASGTRFDVYDPLLDRWEQLPSKPLATGNWAVEAVGGKVYAIQHAATHVYECLL
jgi:kelch-like protein 18